jgi:hypothetical protein
VRVAPEQAGRKGRCPGCSAVLLVPRPDLVSLEKTKNPAYDPDDDERLAQFALSHSQMSRNSDSPEEMPQRRFPAFIDVFLYPFSLSGIANLCIFWFLPIVLAVIPPIWLLGIVLAVIQVIIAGYMYYYLLDCIRDSAVGGIRAPENLGSQPDAMGALSAAWQVTISLVLFWGPLIGYLLYTYNIQRRPVHAEAPDIFTSAVFWCTLLYGAFFFPIGILAMAMMELSEAVKPWIWLRAIFSAFGEYVGLVLGCIVLSILVYLTALVSQAVPVLGMLVRGVDICLFMILGHLIGRFYYRNSRKLGWDE